jgi:peptidoglycan/LPS O-acetylase OafA/YrhL
MANYYFLPKPAMSKRQYSVDALRGVFAIGVMLYHLNFMG